MSEILRYLIAFYVGGFLVAARTMPWVMDRRLHTLDTSNTKAVLARTVQMLLLVAAWPVSVLLLQVTNGVLAAGKPDSPQPEPETTSFSRRRTPRVPSVADPTTQPEPPLLSGPGNAPADRGSKRGGRDVERTLVSVPGTSWRDGQAPADEALDIPADPPVPSGP